MRLAVIATSGHQTEMALEDMIGIAQFGVMTGKVPPPGRWVDDLIEQQKTSAVESIF
jgi:hypothetical protein